MVATDGGPVLPETSVLLMPRSGLSGCISAAIVRDTRAKPLSALERFNHFPATPLVSLTFVLEGETRLVPNGGGIDEAAIAPPFPQIAVMGPQSRPVTSWNPGPVHAISIGFYPDAWASIVQKPLAEPLLDSRLEPPSWCRTFFEQGARATNIHEFWDAFQSAVAPHWTNARDHGGNHSLSRAGLIGDWSRSLATRAMLSASGKSARSLERRIRRWTGQNQRSLAFYAQVEELHKRIVRNGSSDLAGIAHEAGYADQSHMGRAVKRLTGFSPERLNRLIDSHESFWCYRLLGERF